MEGDLVDHLGVCFAFERVNNSAPWTFKSKDGNYSVMPKPRIIVNDIPALLKYCDAGLGLSYTFAESVAELLGRDRFVTVLKKHIAPLPRFSVNYRTKEHMPGRVRAFIELAKKAG